MQERKFNLVTIAIVMYNVCERERGEILWEMGPVLGRSWRASICIPDVQITSKSDSQRMSKTRPEPNMLLLLLWYSILQFLKVCPIILPSVPIILH